MRQSRTELLFWRFGGYLLVLCLYALNLRRGCGSLRLEAIELVVKCLLGIAGVISNRCRRAQNVTLALLQNRVRIYVV